MPSVNSEATVFSLHFVKRLKNSVALFVFFSSLFVSLDPAVLLIDRSLGNSIKSDVLLL